MSNEHRKDIGSYMRLTLGAAANVVSPAHGCFSMGDAGAPC